MNKWVGIGRLCNEPETSYSSNGNPIAKYRIAVNRDYKKDGKQEADFLNCVTFGKGAEFALKNLHKGTKIAVEGRIQTGSYDKDGVRHYTTDIIVERHEFCERKASGDAYDTGNTAAPAGMTAVEIDDLPF